MTSKDIYPAMPTHEVEIMNMLLEQYRPRCVFEWGTGYSTLYFPKKHVFISEWVSVEKDPVWYRDIRQQADADEELKGRVLNLYFPQTNEYINAISRYRKWKQERRKESGRVDFVIVDGRHRMECLQQTSILAPKGTPVVLHDYSRSRYRPGIKAFSHCKVVSPPVEGTPQNDKEKSDDGKYWHLGLMILVNAVDGGKS